MIKEQNSILNETVSIYTDGACSGNPGPGGWACVLLFDGSALEKSGFEAQTTNNRMELLAVINALKCLKRSVRTKIHTDSKYILDAFEQDWIQSWKQKNWKTSQGSAVKNQDLWLELIQLTSKHRVTWQWVKGHAGNKWNEHCDLLARTAIKTQSAHEKRFEIQHK